VTSAGVPSLALRPAAGTPKTEFSFVSR
jgi:hypothetical protein